MSEVKDLQDEMAFEKLKEIAESIGVCMFCTKLETAPFSVRPMSLAKADEEGKLYFLSQSESNKNMELQTDDTVQLLFADPGGARFLNVFGEADILTDMQTIDMVWSPMAKAWFKEGKETPDLTVIRVHPLVAYYWDTKDGKVITLLKIAAAAISGKPADEGVEGTLTINHTNQVDEQNTDRS